MKWFGVFKIELLGVETQRTVSLVFVPHESNDPPVHGGSTIQNSRPH